MFTGCKCQLFRPKKKAGLYNKEFRWSILNDCFLHSCGGMGFHSFRSHLRWGIGAQQHWHMMWFWLAGHVNCGATGQVFTLAAGAPRVPPKTQAPGTQAPPQAQAPAVDKRHVHWKSMRTNFMIWTQCSACLGNWDGSTTPIVKVNPGVVRKLDGVVQPHWLV